MAATRGTSLLKLLHQSAAAQVARYQPAGAQLSAPAFGTSPAQSILRRFFADGTQTVDRSSVEAADVAQKGKEYAQEKTEQTSAAAGELKEKAKDTAGSATEKAKEEGASVTEKVKDQAHKEMNTAQDMVKDVPTKTKETAQDIKEVGIEAAKAVKRDASKIAEKIGLKTPSE